MKLPVLAGIVGLFFGGTAEAIVVKDTFGAGSGSSPTDYSAELGKDSRFDAVAYLFHRGGTQCSGTLISPDSLLTARHCTTGKDTEGWSVSFETGGTLVRRRVSGIAGLPPDPSDPDNIFNGTDLAVLTLSLPLTRITPFRLLTAPTVPGTFTFAGWGRTGTGSTGDTFLDGFRRMAQNEIDTLRRFIDDNALYYADFDDEAGTSNTMTTRFGVPSSPKPLPLEGLGGRGDSGGPLLVERNGEYLATGVQTGFFDFDGDDTANYGSIGAWTGFQSESARALLTGAGATFAPAPVPLPPSGLLLGAILAIPFVLRRRRA